MTLSIAMVCYVLAIVFMLLAAFRVPAAIGWWELSWACFMAAFLFALR